VTTFCRCRFCKSLEWDRFSDRGRCNVVNERSAANPGLVSLTASSAMVNESRRYAAV